MARVYLALIAVQVLFGLWPTAGAIAMQSLSPPALIGYRTLLGGPLMFLAVRAYRRPPAVRDLVQLAVLAGFGVAANQLLYVEGLKRAGPVNAVVLVMVIPVITLLVATALGRERPSRRAVVGVVLTVLGVLALVRGERFDLSDGRMQGNLLILANTTCYAIYLVLAKPVVARLGPMTTVGWVFLLGALEALPWTGPAVVATDWADLPGSAWWSLAFILVGPTIGTYFLNAYALKRAEASVVALFIGLQPVVGAATAWALLGSAPTVRTMASAAVIVVGVLVASRR